LLSACWALLRAAVHAYQQVIPAGCSYVYRSVLGVVWSGSAKSGYSPQAAASCGCSLQFAKAGSVATLSQQEKNNLKDLK
jgi:hypothetical protein